MISHKKLIVPVVALLLCSIAVIGVGFAYSGSYTENAEGTDVNSYALMVDMSQQYGFSTDPVNVKFNTVKQGDNERTYQIAPFSENNNLLFGKNTIKCFKFIVITVTASEQPANGTLDVSINDGWTDSTNFVTNIEAVIDNGETFNPEFPVFV